MISQKCPTMLFVFSLAKSCLGSRSFERDLRFNETNPAVRGIRVLALCLLLYLLGLGVFARAQQARIITFDVQGAGIGPYQGTIATGINPKGQISGYFIDANYAYHGFLRSPDGKVTTFDVPAANGLGTFPVSVNARRGDRGVLQRR